MLPLLACPDCHAPIVIESESATDTKSLTEAALSCSSCKSSFPVTKGIPRLMPKELLDDQKGEIEARDAQVKQYDANTFLNIFGRFEIPKTLRELNLRTSDMLLEAGCGTGRMTSIFAPKASIVVAVDFSFESLLVNQAKLKAAGIDNVHLAQADICNLPFAANVFDRAVSCQVLEHVPGDAAKKKAIESIARAVKQGANIVVSAYQYLSIMGAKEGKHDGGIPFFRFTKSEFTNLLKTQFDVKSVTGSLVYLYLARCVRNAD